LKKQTRSARLLQRPVFFSMEFFYQPEEWKVLHESMPAPMTPKYLIKEVDKKGKRGQDAHFSKHANFHFILAGFFRKFWDFGQR